MTQLLCAVALFAWTTTLRLTAASLSTSQAFPFDPGFDIQSVAALAESLPSHSWEYGTASEALLELYDPSFSVFGDAPFPVPTITASESTSLAYASDKFQIGNGSNTLIDGAGAVGDPASLGISAYLLGFTNETLAAAATAELDYVLTGAPRFWNGAISQRFNYPELWADFMYMAPPFIAYYGAATNNLSTLSIAVEQCELYRQILQTNNTWNTGAWEHIINQVNGTGATDLGIWSTGNGWAAAGMTRVLATVMKAPIANQNGDWQADAVSKLSGYIQEIVDAARWSNTDEGLLRNYWNKDIYGETSGTALLASVAYRMAVLQPDLSAWLKVGRYVEWADDVRHLLGGFDSNGNPHVTSNGTVTPAVNPLNWYDTVPYTAGSPEGQNFVVLMYAAWRDCVEAGVCLRL